MCTVAAAVLAVMSAASTAAQVSAQNSQAKAMGQSAKEAAEADYASSQVQAQQINAQANAEAVRMKRQALVERGRIMAAQGEAGIAGATPLREVYNARLKEQEALEQIATNQGNALLQNAMERQKIGITAQGRYNEARSRHTSGLAAGLMIGTGGATGALQGLMFSKSMKGST